jgi:hypothetical protein
MREPTPFQLKQVRQRILKERRDRQEEPPRITAALPPGAEKLLEGCYRTPARQF